MEQKINQEEFNVLERMLKVGEVNSQYIKTAGFVTIIQNLLKKGLISERKQGYYFSSVEYYYEINSNGILELNIFKNRNIKRKGCPRCGDTDPNCDICCGYTSDGKIHSI